MSFITLLQDLLTSPFPPTLIPSISHSILTTPLEAISSLQNAVLSSEPLWEDQNFGRSKEIFNSVARGLYGRYEGAVVVEGKDTIPKGYKIFARAWVLSLNIIEENGREDVKLSRILVLKIAMYATLKRIEEKFPNIRFGNPVMEETEHSVVQTIKHLFSSQPANIELQEGSEEDGFVFWVIASFLADLSPKSLTIIGKEVSESIIELPLS
jgi:hypothetical protein